MSDEKTAKGKLLVNRGESVFHVKPLPVVDKDGQIKEVGEAIDVAPNQAFHAQDDEQAERLLNYHAISEADVEDPRIEHEIEQHKEAIKKLEAERDEQKKPVVVNGPEAEEKENAADREKRKRHHRSNRR